MNIPGTSRMGVRSEVVFNHEVRLAREGLVGCVASFWRPLETLSTPGKSA